MGAQSSTGKAYISSEVVKALISANLPYDHPMRQELEEKAEIFGDERNLFVRVPDAQGGKAMLADEIERLKHDPRYVATIPPSPEKVPRTDMKKLIENFDAIASGKKIVE
jgi:hypothetical protein